MNLYLGIDFGTSGARAVVIDSNFRVKAQTKYIWETEENKLPHVWQKALFNLIYNIPQEIRGKIRAIAIDGTSATVLLCNSDGKPVTETLLYNDSRGVTMMNKLKSIAPSNHSVISVTSSFAKLLWLTENTSTLNQNQTYMTSICNMYTNIHVYIASAAQIRRDLHMCIIDVYYIYNMHIL